jgi:hypothetical protein
MMEAAEGEDVRKALKVWEGLGNYPNCAISTPATYIVLLIITIQQRS